MLPRTLGAFGLAVYFVAFCAPLAVLAGFLQPAIAFGNGIGAPVAFLAAGLLVLLLQMGCITMGRRMKNPGPFYCYVADGLGKTAALPASLLALVAYLSFAVSSYVYFGLITEHLMVDLFDTKVLPWPLWGFIGLLIVMVLNILRVDISARAIAVCVILEVLIVAVYQAVVFTQGGPGGYSPQSFNPVEFLSGSPGLAVLFALNTLVGIEAMAVFREEVRDPDRTVPRAAYSAIAFTTVFFALAAWSYIVAVGPDNAVENARNIPVDSFFATVTSYLGGTFATLISVLLVTSQLAAANSCQASAIRYLYTLGRDGVLPKSLGRVHPRLRSPFVATLAGMGISLVAYLILAQLEDVVLIYAAVGTFGMLCLMVVLMGTCVSILRFFRRESHVESRVKTVVAPCLALVGFAAVLLFAVTHVDLMLGSSLAGVICAVVLLLIVLVGAALAVVLRTRRPEVYARIGRQSD